MFTETLVTISLELRLYRMTTRYQRLFFHVDSCREVTTMVTLCTLVFFLSIHSRKYNKATNMQGLLNEKRKTLLRKEKISEQEFTREKIKFEIAFRFFSDQS